LDELVRICEDAMNALLFVVLGALPGETPAEPAPEMIKSAVASGLKRIQQGAANASQVLQLPSSGRAGHGARGRQGARL
jgi:hypothetical protein